MSPGCYPPPAYRPAKPSGPPWWIPACVNHFCVPGGLCTREQMEQGMIHILDFLSTPPSPPSGELEGGSSASLNGRQENDAL